MTARRNTRRKARTRTILTAAVTAVALVAAGCGSSGTKSTGGGANTASATGITATTVTIGSHQPLTGPAAPGYSEIAPAAKAYFDYVNAHGGINGRTIVYKYLDDTERVAGPGVAALKTVEPLRTAHACTVLLRLVGAGRRAPPPRG